MKGTLIDKRYMDLHAMIGANLPDCVGEAELEYYLTHREEIPEALRGRGFVIPRQVQAKVTVDTPRLYELEETDLTPAIANSFGFSRKFLGSSDARFREMFDFPTALPWRNVLVIFDPCLTNREAVDRALKAQNLDVYEENNVMEYSGSEKDKEPTLYLIENSLRPTADTLGDNAKTPDQLNADGRFYLPLRGYALAFGQRFLIQRDYLDPETCTWFPHNRLPDGKVARGDWDPNDREVKFFWGRPGNRRGSMGARLAIRVSLKP